MINSIDIKEKDRFNELGLLVNSKFSTLFNLDDILSSVYDYVYGYYIEDKLIGFIHCTKMYEQVDIVNVVVDKEYRKQGIGTKLLNYVFDTFNDVSNYILEVNEKNSAAINLYSVNNFVVINKREKYYGNDDALIMKRDVVNEGC